LKEDKRQFQQRASAMAAGLTDHIWSAVQMAERVYVVSSDKDEKIFFDNSPGNIGARLYP
jgi:hypothetical protein